MRRGTAATRQWWRTWAPQHWHQGSCRSQNGGVHFDLLDLTELTDMSDQELAEVFADSDDEQLTSESPAGLHPLPRAGCLRSPSWTRARAEQNREKQPLGDPERQPLTVDTVLTVERPKED
ncbi:dysbindin domain-containing protein 1 isoform X3 [Rhinolophus ferrumequinum]|uniref:dysbindin domain-containing protein 1 isoform X3 n=1 Tax=Rhinolophus ferrumequinum TaxID=59479 RepID=UPI00140FEA46|nr:dysbindin domain-containing protein 1 isoform X3 [Rhinolophus ferrumequinum]XP_032983859.1 dysbindin domain-containing protein 1 isoform X3 [Rhinolophus ferrumequinum]XP_032983860.1 dysbindin domain-containing protein 1 isoform X3 [Rhinolophus ferrumequinum]XP_032983861.1 dysbindin domain-containing protein 1 isoform X3 [Rhinolophus ferrumequinum]